VDSPAGRRLRSLSFEHFPRNHITTRLVEVREAMDGRLGRWLDGHTGAGGLRLSIGEMVSPYGPTFSYLDDLKSLPVEQIAMGGFLDFLGDFKPQDFAWLNLKFADPRSFAPMKTVYFVYAGKLSPKQVQKRVEQVLPALVARGVKIEVRKIPSFFITCL